MRVYAKNYPVGAGMSSLNVNALWRAADGAPAPRYIRGVPTGPLSADRRGDHDVGRLALRRRFVSHDGRSPLPTSTDLRADIVRRIDALE